MSTSHRLFRHPQWGLGRLIKESGSQLELIFSDDTTRTLDANTEQLEELDSTSVWVVQQLGDELERFGTLCPRWVKYPTIPRRSIGWRMGSGESYMWMMTEWTTGWTPEQHVAHLRDYAPLPLMWARNICWHLGAGDPTSDPSAREVLEERGLLRRHPYMISRSFDEFRAPTQTEAIASEVSPGVRGRDHARMTLIVAMMNGPQWATGYCVRASESKHDAVRAHAAQGLGHIARLHGDLDAALTRPVLQRALADEGNYVRHLAGDALRDIAYYAGWQL